MRHLLFPAMLLVAMAGCAAPGGQPKADWRQASLASSYDNETQDFGLAPTRVMRMTDYEGPTPITVEGAVTITTPQLRAMMTSATPPILIDVLGGHVTVSLPGAIWLPGAGGGGALDDPLQPKFAARLAELTGGDKAKPIVFFCLSHTCWLSYNASLRAVALGYTNVRWYRGGRNAWRAAGLPLEPVQRLSL